MNHWIRSALLVAALLCSSITNAQGLSDFFAAYRRGDYVTAINGFRPAADKGDAVAQFMLGQMYEGGEGVKQDDQAAFSWFLKSAEQGFDLAQAEIGLSYSTGRGVAQNEELAFKWYLKAAEQGLARAQARAGVAYFFGNGTEKNPQQAIAWGHKAVAQNDEWGQVLFGMAYASGSGVPRDDQQSTFWYLKAANQGNTYAQSVLAGVFGLGLGVTKDLQQGYFWSLLASAKGDKNATTLRDKLEEMLTPQQKASAQAQARNWKPMPASGSSPPSSRDSESASPANPHLNRQTRVSPTSTGSGFIVARGLIVTNHHVVNNCSRMSVNGTPAEQRASDARSDLALLGAAISGNPVSLRNQRVALGETVSVAGYPLRSLLSGFNVTTGNLSSMSGIGGNTQLIQITAPVQPGNSGGPVLDSAGNLIGVVVSKLDAIKAAKVTGDIAQNVNFAINANVLRSFLDANNVAYTSSNAERVLPTTAVAERAKFFTVLVECWQ